MNRQIDVKRNQRAASEHAVFHAAKPTARLFAGVAINVLGAAVLFSESFRFLNAGL